MAAIGEQFLDDVVEGDDICGLSVSPREKDDLIQVRTRPATATGLYAVVCFEIKFSQRFWLLHRITFVEYFFTLTALWRHLIVFKAQ